MLAPPAPQIGDYAVIGDCRSAALVSRQGSIDWLCLPHFSAPSIFGALLDAAEGGRFAIAPVARSPAKRRYVGPTNVLETTFQSDQGALRLTDFMPMPAQSQRIEPQREVTRIVEAVGGPVAIELVVDPRPDYGRRLAKIHRRGEGAWAWEWGSHFLSLTVDAPANWQVDGAILKGRIDLQADQRCCVALAYVEGEIAVEPPLGDGAHQRLRDTIAWWQSWSARCQYAGPYREPVLRSALALKLMTYALSGAVVAAPTTSLPEALGGCRNWDYRFCWLRDAALTMQAFTGLGYMQEARAFLDWLLHTTRLTAPKLGVLYDVYGRPKAQPQELSHWRGFAGSQPVRIGNQALEQLQLDVYGSVIFAARNFVESGGNLDAAGRKLLAGFGGTVMEQWRQPDHSIWEVPGERRQYTYSKVMCWTALDSLQKLHQRGLVEIDAARLAHEKDGIRQLVDAQGYNKACESYVGVLDSDDPDASLLLMACLGYRDAADPRMRGTFRYLHQRLSRNGLLYRYPPGADGLPGIEGAFGICSFWAIDHLAARGEIDEACRAFEHVVSFANDVGLLSEQIDPQSGALLGNFPQAFTHVGLINAAAAIARAQTHRAAA